MSETVIFERNVTNNFTMLPNHIIRDKRLSWKAVGLISYLWSLPPNFKWLSITHLANQKDTGETATRTGLRELERAGYLLIERQQDASGRFTKTLWQIRENRPDGDHASPHGENPRMDNPHAPKREVENQPLINTSNTKTKKKNNTTTSANAEDRDLVAPELHFSSDQPHSARDKIASALEGVEAADRQRMLDDLMAVLKAGAIRTTPLQWLHGAIKKYRAGTYNFTSQPPGRRPKPRSASVTPTQAHQGRHPENGPPSVKTAMRSVVGVEHLNKLRVNRSKNAPTSDL